MMGTKTKNIKRAWLIGRVYIAANDEREARKVYAEYLEPPRKLPVTHFEGPYMVMESEDGPEFETDEEGFVNMLKCHNGYWYD